MGYDGLGAEVARAPLALILPGDCGADDVTFGAFAILVTSRPMLSAEIHPMSPLTFPVFDETGRAASLYTVSPRFRAQTSELRLACTPVVRGQTTTCTASASPSSSRLEVLGWSFTSTDPTVPFNLERETEPSATTWTGPAAVRGTVTVTGLVDGMSRKATAPLAVTARDWTGRTVRDSMVEDTATLRRLPLIPGRESDLGDVVFVPQDYTTSETLVLVPDGPNAGLFYFANVPLKS